MVEGSTLLGGLTADGVSGLTNRDLAPVAPEARTWGIYNYAALWVGMAHNVTTYLLASALISLGMSWEQALLTIALGNVLVLAPMLLTSEAGARYGIPFPVFARASFGIYGANVAAMLRAAVACGWFGIDVWIGGEAIYRLIAVVAGRGWADSRVIGGHPLTLWLSFACFLALNLLLLLPGIAVVRRFENVAAPAVLVVAVAALVWITIRAGGLGPLVSRPSRLGWGGRFWAVFAPSLMAMVAFWAPLSLNMPDFTRFARSQRAQRLGQVLGLPTTMTLFSLLAVLIVSGSAALYGRVIWDPVALTARVGQPVVVVVALLTIVVATLAVNVPANLVSPAYDFSNLRPGLISFRVGAVLTAVIAVLIQPWRLLASPHLYIFAWLEFVGGALGAVVGVQIGHYWLVTRRVLALPELYDRAGRYRYASGFNLRALAALALGVVLALGGAYSTGSGPFPSTGLLPPLRPLYDYSWAIGIATSATAIYLLHRVFPNQGGGV